MSFILAVDLGKYNSAFCGFDTATGEVELRSAKTTPSILRDELTLRAGDRVVIEACSPAGWVHTLCGTLGMGNSVRQRRHRRTGGISSGTGG